mgnify:FL=1
MEKIEFNTEMEGLCEFIDGSPDPFHTVENVKDSLRKNGFAEIFENDDFKIERGKNYFLSRNGSSLIAFKIPKARAGGYNIFCCHSDSPTFKIKENPERACEGAYTTLNVEFYGGGVVYRWFDRPLSISGRVFVKSEDGVKARLVNFRRDMLCIPSLAPHMMSAGEAYEKVKVQKELCPLASLDKDFCLNGILADALFAKREDILSYDLFIYPTEKAKVWGQKDEFFSAPRIDDLLCVYTGLRGFLQSENDSRISLYTLFDNEEVGSSSRQGALSDFLILTLKRINSALGFDEDQLYRDLSKSFALSADNGHALHPNYTEKADPTNRPVMGGGVLLKYSANQKYTTDGLSAAVFKTILEQNGVPFQVFTNHSDVAGGCTLGNLSTRQVSLCTADIGAAQFAMHSPVETCSSKDALSLILAAKAFYSSAAEIEPDGSFSVKQTVS